MSEPAMSSRRRAARSAEATARSAALDRLKSMRSSGGRRTEGVQVRMEEPIYDTVDEADYDRLVAERRESAKDFIVDDDGLGYGDEGQEEDWAQSGLPPSSDEEDEPEGGVKTAKRKAQKKDPPPPKKPAPTSLSAAAAMMGKQRLSAMFTSSAFKKNDRVKGSSSESIVDDLIVEFAPDEADREARRRKRGLPSLPPAAPHHFVVAPVSHVNSEMPDFLEDTGVPEIQVSVLESGAVGVPLENGNSSHHEERGVEVKEEKNVECKVESSGNGHMDLKNGCSKVEVKVEPLAVPHKRSMLNAKIEAVKDNGLLSATAAWNAFCEMEGRGSELQVKSEEKSELMLDSNGSLSFYLIDAHEEAYGSNSGTLYLFGKIKAGNAYQSCCLVVKNMQRCVYAIPKGSVFQNDEIKQMEKSLADSRISATEFRMKLQEMASDLKNEMVERLVEHKVSSFSMMPVKRSYAFERMDVPHGEQYVLKIGYPFKEPSLSPELKGELLHCLLGMNTSALELFLVKRKIKGPSWLSISKFALSPPNERVSWCKFEITVDCPKDIIVSTSKSALEIPPVIVTAINLKTIISEKQSTNEIVSASVICCHKAKIDGPMMTSEWNRPNVLSHFTVIRKLEGGVYPMGFANEVADRNSKAGSNVLILESSERALVNRLMVELHKLDTDVLLGHNISGFDLDVLLHRAQICKVPSSNWSKIGRLKRSVMPKLTKGNTVYGSGASPGISNCIAGRLLCDTFLSSRDLLKEVSYSLTQLAKTQLNKQRKEIAPQGIPSMFQSSASLLELVKCGEVDASLSLELMFHLSVLPLTRQLTNISGNLWAKTLQGARAQRVEYLLLHAFHAKKYIVPDKNSAKNKASVALKRKVNNGAGSENVDKLLFDEYIDAQSSDQVKGKKGPAYAGGLVLEPKKGLYDKYVLLLDFNSLYPSIIQEYNICFTTVERCPDGPIPTLPASRMTGVLPELLRSLVERRRMVKSWLKTAIGLKVQQLDIQQQALKLTANSMYGCLGFSNSRFFAKPLAELITLQGREILQSTVDLVQNTLNLEVIYGDTDSIMIYSGLDDITKAKGMAVKVIQEVNKKYRCLEIDLDGLYKRMLLLKKKKYAAVKVQFKDGTSYEVIERKGLDMVRRDWSLLSKDMGDRCLNEILSGRSCEEVVETIHSSLMEIQEKMRNGDVKLEDYVITKTLTKSPEEYPDGRNQPHVLVALRMKQCGYTTGCSAGDTIPYVICCEKDSSSGSSAGIAERARHPDELKRDNGNWMIDVDYYLSQQIHPVVSRLCASIQGTSPARLADCLGLDSSRFQNKTSESSVKDPSSVLVSVLDDDDRFHGCEPLRLVCPSCSCNFDCPPVSTFLSSLADASQLDAQLEKDSENNFWKRIRCPKCPDSVEGSRISSAILTNQVRRQAEKFIALHYRGLMMCDDELCKHITCSLNLRIVGDSERGTICPNYPRCNGHLIRQYTEADLYKQLSFFCHVFNYKRCLEKLDPNVRALFEKELSRFYPVIDSAAKMIEKIRDRCAYGWVQLADLALSV